MGHKSDIRKVMQIRKLLDKVDADSKLSSLLGNLSEIPMTKETLKETKIANTLLKIKNSSKDDAVKRRISSLFKEWAKDGTKEKGSSKTTYSKDSTSIIPPPFEITAPVPSKNSKGIIIFEDHPEFQPNLTPKEVLQAGSFGGTYFRPIYSTITKSEYKSEAWEELPRDWYEGLNIKTQVASSIYDASKNKYGVKCGGSLEMWESSGWIDKQDPYGWFQWYCRFYQGRRSPDDERQIDRWAKCCGAKGRWKNNLIGKIFKARVKYDNPAVSPVIRQVLLHWAYELTERDYLKRAKELK